MEEPRFIREGYRYFDKKEMTWKIKDDAPAWAKAEFDEFMKLMNPVPDENGIITQY